MAKPLDTTNTRELLIRSAAVLETLTYLREVTNNQRLGRMVEHKIVQKTLDDLAFQTSLFEIDSELKKRREE